MNNEIELTLQKAIADDGFAVVEQVLSKQTIEFLIEAIAYPQKSSFVKCRGNSIYAIRNLLEVPEVRALASKPPIIDLASTVLGTAFAVKAILFNKTTQANWKVAWHQDLTIAVKEKKVVEGFSAWSEKAGIPLSWKILGEAKPHPNFSACATTSRNLRKPVNAANSLGRL